MEIVEGGDLYRYMKEFKRLEINAALNVFYQLVEALKLLNEKGIVHRDLKLENILISTKEIEKAKVKITDFGLADLWNS